MTGTVLVTTHRLPLAGALREAFQAEGYRVDLVPSPEHGEGVEDAALLVLTGERDGAPGSDGELWARLARDTLGVPLFSALPGPGGVRRGEVLEATEVFADPPSPDEVALVGRRTMERRRLQALTGIVGDSEAIRELLERVVQIAPVDSTVLVTGESGTGKELVARGIHALSARKHRAFLAVNVAALSETLLESELFGHVKGAFTGAVQSRRGLFEAAQGGTLFLDEISTISPAIQVKLLRVLQERRITPVGGTESIPVDFRLVAATNEELEKLVEGGTFREDLYYRLNVFPIRVPPLRERKEDIPILANAFRIRFAEENGVSAPEILPETLSRMMAYDWPGNVRELENAIERALILHSGARSLPFEPSAAGTIREERSLLERASGQKWSLDRLEREYILETLDAEGWHQGRASEILGINRRTLYRKLRQYREEGVLPDSRGGSARGDELGN